MPALSEIKPSKESSYDDTNPNACACCPEPCRVCLQPLSTACSTVKLDLKLHGQMWKASFGNPSACGKCLSPKAFFAVRLSIFIIWLACTLWSMINWVTEEELGFDYWWTKLTHWTATYELIYLGFAMMTTYRALWGSTPDGTGDQTPWFVSVTWAMQSSVLPISFFVCILYWALVYDPDKGLGVLSVLMHGLNFVLAFADMLLCRQPMYLCHIFLPLAYAATYLLFSYIYYAADGTHEDGESRYIYKALDWGNPGKTARLGGVIVLVVLPIVWVLFYCVFLARRCVRKMGEPDETTKGTDLTAP